VSCTSSSRATLGDNRGLERKIAIVDEAQCIGCARCIEACPVDAIVGAQGYLHTVVEDWCIGCELCLPPCPVDCIALVPIEGTPLARERVMRRATHAKTRFDARNLRLSRERAERDARRAPATDTQPEAQAPITRAAVLDAIARGKARREALKSGR